MKKLSIHKPVCPFWEIISLDLTTATVEEFKDFLVKYIYGFKVYLEDYSGDSTNLINVRLDPRFIDYMKKFFNRPKKDSTFPNSSISRYPSSSIRRTPIIFKNI